MTNKWIYLNASVAEVRDSCCIMLQCVGQWTDKPVCVSFSQSGWVSPRPVVSGASTPGPPHPKVQPACPATPLLPTLEVPVPLLSRRRMDSQPFWVQLFYNCLLLCMMWRKKHLVWDKTTKRDILRDYFTNGQKSRVGTTQRHTCELQNTIWFLWLGCWFSICTVAD